MQATSSEHLLLHHTYVILVAEYKGAWSFEQLLVSNGGSLAQVLYTQLSEHSTERSKIYCLALHTVTLLLFE